MSISSNINEKANLIWAIADTKEASSIISTKRRAKRNSRLSR